jgi:hypothetical protein
VSHRGPPTCYNTSRLTRCHRAVVSNSCHFFRRPLPIPLATYAIGEGRGQPVRKVPSRDGYPRASSLVVERWREMRAQQHSASRITDRGFSDIHVQKALLVGCAPSHFTGSGMSRHHADRHPPSPLDRRESNVDDGRGAYLGNVPEGEPTTTSSSTACLQGPLLSLHCRRHYDYHSYGLPSSREV